MVREGRNPGNFVTATNLSSQFTCWDSPGEIQLHPWHKKAEIKPMSEMAIFRQLSNKAEPV
jgi:hypothetical protein